MSADLFGILGFLFVVLRAATLCCQTIAAGGVIFSVLVARGPQFRRGSWLSPSKRLIRWASLGVAISQVSSIVVNTLVLTSSSELRVRDILSANYVIAGALSSLAALALFLWADWIRDRASVLLVPVGAMIAASVMTSHSASRVDGRVLLIALTSIHYMATAAWIGGLPYLLFAMKRADNAEFISSLGRNFSRLAATSVSLLILAGLGLSSSYVHSWEAVYGTAYGVMIATKGIFFGCLILLGAANYFLIRGVAKRLSSADIKLSILRFVEAEIGIGLTIILTAASLTSQPPAVDLTQERVTMGEIATRYAPRMPRIASPDVQQLSESSSEITLRSSAGGRPIPITFLPGDNAVDDNTAADIAWSEYNHAWAGIVVFLMGCLALMSRSKRFSWARMWPLLFLGLALFLFLRADPENWPLGPNGFWKSFGVADVLQHRLAIIMIIVFAILEWRVQTGRVQSQYAKLVFPAVCALGGAVLLTHSHGLTNLKEQLLIEISHTPVAILGVVAGWSRWLEVRLPSSNPAGRRLAWVWPVCFILIGLILMDYHEADIVRSTIHASLR